MKNAISFLSVLIAAALLTLVAGNWQVMPGTKTNFTINGLLGVDVNGTIEISKAEIKFNPDSLQAASMWVKLDVNSINTGIKSRDGHLKTADFFDAKKFPEISFNSTSLQKTGDGNYLVNGKLSIKDSARQVSIPFTFSQSGKEGKFTGEFSINRLDYGIGRKSMSVGNEVKIHLMVPVTQ